MSRMLRRLASTLGNDDDDDVSVSSSRPARRARAKRHNYIEDSSDKDESHQPVKGRTERTHRKRRLLSFDESDDGLSEEDAVSIEAQPVQSDRKAVGSMRQTPLSWRDYLPTDWISATAPRRTPYIPQLHGELHCDLYHELNAVAIYNSFLFVLIGLTLLQTRSCICDRAMKSSSQQSSQPFPTMSPPQPLLPMRCKQCHALSLLEWRASHTLLGLLLSAACSSCSGTNRNWGR